MRRWWTAVLVALALVAASCSDDEGGSDESQGSGEVAVHVAERIANAGPLDGLGGESYVPTGEIIADTGFRPDVDGFSFENYGNENDPQNLTPASIELLFGEQVCIAGTGDDCLLTPAGQRWMETQNEIMDGGHCMGLSVAALRMFAGTLDPTDYGDEIPNWLEFENPELQSTIAESFVYQMIPSIDDERTEGSPTEILYTLIDFMNEGEDFYTLGFYMADGNGGHAVTPLAVEDQGDGNYVILVYDNNYPNMVRPFEIDEESDSFSYNGSPNPDIEEMLYEGDATTMPLDLTPTLIGEELQPCPFCRGEEFGGEAKGSRGSVLPAARQYAEVALVGDRLNRPRLLFTDAADESKRTGIIDGRLVNDIEGVQVITQYAVDPSAGGPEPKYRLPLDKDVVITIDGSHLQETATDVTINYTAPGKVIEVEDITIAPGQQDHMFVDTASYTIVYETNNEEGAAPSFFAGVDDTDASYTLGATVVGVEPGSLIGVAILEEEGQVLFDLSDAVATDGSTALAILAIGMLDASGEHVWINEGVAIDTSAGEDLFLNYKQQQLTPGSPIDIEIGPEGGPYRIEQAAYSAE